MQINGNKNCVENLLVDLFEAEQRLQREEKILELRSKYGVNGGWDKFEETMEKDKLSVDFLNVLLSFLDEREKIVIRRFFGEKKKYAAEDLSLTLNLERASVYRIRKSAIEKIAATIT